MSLFTQSEASRFHSFLSQVDVSETFNISDWPFFPEAIAVPQTEGTEELSKATRTLMALDSSTPTPRNSVHSAAVLANRQWPDPPAPFQPPASHGFSHKQLQLQLQHSDPLFYPPPPPLPQPPVLRHPLLAAIDNSQLFFQPTHILPPPQSQPPIQPPTPTSTTFPPPQSPLEPESPTNTRKRSASGRENDTSQASAPPKKRARPAPASSPNDASTSDPTLPRQPKAHLLTTSQKKANHIQSEQKRRANIRQGYESLCEVVPALREAIKAEEEINIAVAHGTKKKAKATRGTDGRAGPKSECAVLQKTIDHIMNLVETRAALIARLNHARTLLHPQHPAQTPILPPSIPGAPAVPVWERQWDGGSGMEEDDDDDDDDD